MTIPALGIRKKQHEVSFFTQFQENVTYKNARALSKSFPFLFIAANDHLNFHLSFFSLPQFRMNGVFRRKSNYFYSGENEPLLPVRYCPSPRMATAGKTLQHKFHRKIGHFSRCRQPDGSLSAKQSANDQKGRYKAVSKRGLLYFPKHPRVYV